MNKRSVIRQAEQTIGEAAVRRTVELAQKRGHGGMTMGAGIGAVAGALAGSFLGPWGAIAGATLGSAAGVAVGQDVDTRRK
jgi:hypothetical protein